MSEVRDETTDRDDERSVVGYERERRRVRELLDRSGAVILLGPPGAGKTSLLDRFSEGAGERTLLRCAGYDGEQDLAYAGLHDLLTPLVPDIDRLGPPRRSAVRAALALEETPPPDPLSVAAGTLELVLASAPALILVDDLQWLDDSSAQVARFVARRLEGSGVGAVLATRDDVPHGLEQVELDGIDHRAVRLLIEQVAGTAPADRVVDEVRQVTGGLPMAVRAAALGLSHDQLDGREPLGDVLDLAAEPARPFLPQLRSLSEDGRRAAGVLAAAGRLSRGSFAPALRELGIEDWRLDELEQHGLLAGAEDPLTFAHPLLRAAAWSLLREPERRLTHRALAVTVQDPERRAHHLASAVEGPDDEAAEALAEAADLAGRRGGLVEAARLLERAADLTPDRDLQLERRLRAVQTWHVTGDHDRALRSLGRTDPPSTGTPLHAIDLRADVLTWGAGPRRARDYLLQQAAASPDRGRRAALICRGAVPSIMAGAVTESRQEVEEALPDLPTDDPQLAVPALVAAAEVIALTGDPDRAMELLEPALAQLETGEHDLSSLAATLMLTHVLMIAHRWEDARRRYEGLIDGARRSGRLAVLPFSLVQLADLDIRWGHLATAAARLEEAEQLVRAAGTPTELPHALAMRARLAAMTGDEERCREAVDEARRYAEQRGAEALTPYIEHALGLLHLGRGAADRAVVHLADAQRIMDRHGVRSVTAVPALPDLIEASVAIGDDEMSRTRLEDLADRAAADPNPWTDSALARSKALVERDASHLAEARRAAREAGTEPDAARADLVEGELRRRDGDVAASRRHLAAALAYFERIGARPWADRASRELRAAGGRSRPLTDELSLTPQQQRVAELVAEGATNIEIAATLFLSVKTIENHLSRIYERLGIRSRTELATLTLSGDATT